MSPRFHYGVTGSSQGASPRQLERLGKEMRALPADAVQHNGLCVGADFQLARLGRSLGHRIIGHPGVTSSGQPYRRCPFKPDEERAEQPFLDRNSNIVRASELILAAPGQESEVLRSGTWATIRRARKAGVRALIITPTGRQL